jgi:hypothetical protein
MRYLLPIPKSQSYSRLKYGQEDSQKIEHGMLDHFGPKKSIDVLARSVRDKDSD